MASTGNLEVGLNRICHTLILVAAALSISACSIHFSTGSSKESMPEVAYSQAVRSGLAMINQAATGLHPVCDKGGQVQGCFAASQRMIAAIARLQQTLGSQHVPSRFVTADTALRRGLATDLTGFTTRNRGIAGGGNADWDAGQTKIREGTQQINAALVAYSADAGLAP